MDNSQSAYKKGPNSLESLTGNHLSVSAGNRISAGLEMLLQAQGEF